MNNYRQKTRHGRFVIIITLVLAIIVLAGISSFVSLQNSENIKADVNSPDIVVNTDTSNLTEPTKPQTVCLDPGHGGKDVGAVYKKLTEADLNLKVAVQVRNILQKNGYKVYLTRTDDSFVFKRPRARYCNSVKASILVAIHHNSYGKDTSVNYSTGLYFKDSDQALAANILDAVSGKLKTKNQGIAKFDDSELYIATMPAALSEGFFITSKSEYEQIVQKNYSRLNTEAEGIAAGIENYFTNPVKPSDTINSDSLILDRSDYGD